jgi:hypothetical protein
MMFVPDESVLSGTNGVPDLRDSCIPVIWR